ncbi:DUF262 domain-containing protein [Novosphingobium resinovorum]|uniref:DUF262 domain-containing protein n=1 Tax=Novosphingobium TaxID=165696 RepID=UPI001B3C8104|nr:MULTISPECIES: DUF262 domain-containing protein [Novosphingobium]MBF7010616.1 DUF262 domain-containing protein [Novosphingobium sp. HR1a]WJM28613.1 DUF262 domain-containing protein [Novosphingobium resinovorum]
MNRDLFGDVAEVEGQEEGLDDVGGVSTITVHQSVVSGTDWTAETIISQIDKGNIQLNPRFQRRDAWESSRKSQFVESLILGLPIPQLVLAESPAKRGSYIVIDGKQRLLSIRQFAAKANDPTFNQLKLSGLTIRDDLKGETLETLRNDPTRGDDVAAFENQPIRTVVIKNWGSENFLYQVFLRLNTGSVPLSTQELRQALHPGEFLEFIDEESVKSAGLKRVLKLKKPDFRMRDAELLTRWYAFQHFAPLYSGDLKTFLDNACAALNKLWTGNESQIRAELLEFEASIDACYNIFGDHAFRKWTSGNYERLFNRAIFDVMTYYFAVPHVRAAAEASPALVVQAFQDLCDNDEDFRASIERTTKSMGATSKRFDAWAGFLTTLSANVISPL